MFVEYDDDGNELEIDYDAFIDNLFSNEEDDIEFDED